VLIWLYLASYLNRKHATGFMWIATSTVHTTEIATLQEQKYYKVSEKEKEIT